MKLQMQGVSFFFEPGFPVLEHLDWEVPARGSVGICGPNGCGKSTFLKLLAGLLLPQSGQVLLDGARAGEGKFAHSFCGEVGYVFQNPENQVVATSVEEDVVFGMENLGMARSHMEQRLGWVLNRVGLSGLEKRHPQSLSGGQKQRLAIASVLAMGSQLLLLDEPTSMLDPQGASEIAALFQSLVGDGIVVVLASHQSELLMQMEHLVFLDERKILLQGSPWEVLSQQHVQQKVHLTEWVRYQLRAPEAGPWKDRRFRSVDEVIAFRD